MVNPTNKYFLAIFLAVSLFAGFCEASQALSQKVVDYQFPLIPGWSYQLFNSDVNSSLTQMRTVDGDKCGLKVVCFKTPSGVQVETTADGLRQLSTKEMLDSNTKLLSGQVTTFRGYPAYMTESMEQTPTSTTYTRILRFTDKRNLYWVQLTLHGNPISSNVKSAGEQAWRIVGGATPNASNAQTVTSATQTSVPTVAGSAGRIYLYFLAAAIAVIVLILLVWRARARTSNNSRKTAN